MALPGKELPWIVDGDGHVREPDRLYDEFLPSRYRHLRPRTEVDGTRSRYVVGDVKGGWKTTRIQPRNTGSANKAPIPVMRGEWDPLARLEDMHLDGISHAVLFPTQGMAFGCVADRDAASALSRAYNDWLGEYCSADPEHLRHVAHVPFGHIADAVTELERAKEAYDSVGVYLRPNPYPPYESGGKFASDPGNEPFWEAAEELGVAVCFHEAALLVVPTPGLDRFGPEEYYLIHAGAHPIGQMMAMLETIGTGVLDRHPRLRVGFLEAGCGWVPGWLHRFDAQRGGLGRWGAARSPPLRAVPRPGFRLDRGGRGGPRTVRVHVPGQRGLRIRLPSRRLHIPRCSRLAARSIVAR